MPLKIKITKIISLPTSVVSKKRWQGELEENRKKLQEYLVAEEDILAEEIGDIVESIVKATWVDEEAEVDELDDEEDDDELFTDD